MNAESLIVTQKAINKLEMRWYSFRIIFSSLAATVTGF